MEYEFENNGKKHSIKLDLYSLIYKINDDVSVVRYAQINKVRLSRPRSVNDKKLFACTIQVTDGPDIHLQSISKSGNELNDQFNHYTQFIRVLHFHLISKSNAKFRYGMSYNTILAYSIIAVVSLLLSYVVSLRMDSSTTLLYFTAPIIIGFFIYKILGDRPCSYRPDIIPYHILPGNSQA